MKDILFIHTHQLDGASGGAQRTLQALNGLKNNYNVFEYPCFKPASKIKGLIRNLQLYSGMMTKNDERRILSLIKENNFEFIFFDCSLHGKVIKSIKKYNPSQKIVVNYHNNESNYYYDMFRLQGLPYYLVFKAASYNERLSNNYGDFHVFISKEDMVSMNMNGNSVVIPVTLKDNYKNEPFKTACENYVLFLGSAFFANIEAVNYIINEIAPNTKIKCKVVGKGMKKQFPSNYKNVEICDYVPSLTELMVNAMAFISPIFSGSGTKIKIAESLMYGKKILGTKESFFGYETEFMDYEICNNATDFLSAINRLNPNEKFFGKNRDLFLARYDSKKNAEYYSHFDF